MNNYDAWKLQEPPEPVDLECCDQSSDAACELPCGCVDCAACGFYGLCKGCARLEASGL